MDPNKKPQKTPRFVCDICSFITNNKKDYNKHVLTPKHNNLTSVSKILNKNPNVFSCNNCEKTYKHLSSLCFHKQKCVYNEHTPNNITIVFDQDKILEETSSIEDQELNQRRI